MLECTDCEYEVHVGSFSGPTRATRDEPGDGGEIELAPFADVFRGQHKVGVVPVEVALLDLASATGTSVAEARSRVEDELLETCLRDAADDFDDRDADAFGDEDR